MEFEKVVLDKLDKIELKQIEHTIELAKNTLILTDHHVRTSNLEARVRPIENQKHFLDTFSKAIIALIGALAGLGAIYHYLVK